VKRRLFNITAGASLLLYTALLILWVRSYLRSDIIQTPDRRHAFDTSPGRIWIYVASRPFWAGIQHSSISAQLLFPFNPDYGGLFRITRVVGRVRFYASCGFVYCAYPQGNGTTAVWFTDFAVPFWFLTLAAGAFPMFWLRFHLKRTPHGHCATCNYDLRATPDRCPECGTIPAKKEVISS
jgi:hypothetical protein